MEFEKSLAALDERVRALEKAPASLEIYPRCEAPLASVEATQHRDDPKERRRVEDECARLGIVFRMYRVPDTYYERTLKDRMSLVGAPSVGHLCKSVIMKNVAWVGTTSTQFSKRNDAQYYLILVQYAARIDEDKLCSAIRNLLPAEVRKVRFDVLHAFGYSRMLANSKKKARKQFSFRLATQEESDSLSGFRHNAVSPVGLRQVKLPIIIAKAITQLKPSVIWLGGGEVDLKLQVNVDNFSRAIDALPLDISVPRI